MHTVPLLNNGTWSQSVTGRLWRNFGFDVRISPNLKPGPDLTLQDDGENGDVLVLADEPPKIVRSSQTRTIGARISPNRRPGPELASEDDVEDADVLVLVDEPPWSVDRSIDLVKTRRLTFKSAQTDHLAPS